MQEHVCPNEQRYYREAEELGPWAVYPVVEELEPKARAGGLWNLFLPASEHGAGLSNFDYAPLCEIMGRSPHSPRSCRIAIFMGKSDPDIPDRHRQQSMILVPMDTPGVKVVRPIGVFGFYGVPDRASEVVFENVRVLASNTLPGEGRGFEIAMIKVAAPNMACKVSDWAIQAYGGGGTNNDVGLASAYATARLLRLADGPDELHRQQIGSRSAGWSWPSTSEPSSFRLRNDETRAARLSPRRLRPYIRLMIIQLEE